MKTNLLISGMLLRNGRTQAPAKLTLSNLHRLQTYDWPGNVCELQNVIERAVILSTSGNLHFDLPAKITPEVAGTSIGESTTRRETANVLTEMELKALERENILVALKRCEWKIYGRCGGEFV